MIPGTPKQTQVYVVEQYLPGAMAAEARAAVSALWAPISAEALPARLACSLLISSDDLCLHVLVASSSEAAAKRATAAGITPERVMNVTAWFLPDLPNDRTTDA